MDILLALKFLTTLPIPLPAKLPPDAMRRASAYYPLVGLVIGLILAGADWVLGLVFPPFLRSALVLALWVGLTGALHLDGFLDGCDGLLAPVSPERRLEILRDVHTGSFAVVGGVLLLLSKFAALVSLPGPLRFALLIGAPVLARWAIVYALIRYPYARPGAGLGRLVKEGSGRRELAIATAIALPAVMAAWGVLGLAGASPWIALRLWPWGAAALPATWAFTALLAAWVRTRIPGLTGDTYGVIVELTEVVWLVVAVAIAKFV